MSALVNHWGTKLPEIGPFRNSMQRLNDTNDRGNKTMSDPEWLEVVGNPTIPHVQSLRAPPAHVACGTGQDKLVALTNKSVSQRYLQKLHKDRDRNREVLAECVDHLPMTIKQMVYPEKPITQQTWRLATNGTPHSREKKFRVSRHQMDYWHDNLEQWIKDDDDDGSGHSSPREPKRHGSSSRDSINNRQLNGSGRLGSRDRRHGSSNRASREYHPASSLCSKGTHGSMHGSTSSSIVDNEFVHHPGFAGNVGQPSPNLKYKFGKKKGVLALSEQSQQTQSTFRPKGFGSLYDEMEFERRYKKVFDLNKHIHFVHSNFVTGQRIVKRTKLPPIGHVASGQTDQENGDIFAIMSVQKYNHPDNTPRRSPTTPKYASRRTAEKSPKESKVKRNIEIPQSISGPLGFVPGTIKPTGMSPFNGVVGSNDDGVVQKELPSYRLPSLSMEGDSAVGTLTEYASNTPRADEYLTRSARSNRTFNSKKTKHSEDEKVKSEMKKSRLSHHTDKWSENTSETADDPEPFNISVHVEIKQREHVFDEQDEESDSDQDIPLSPVHEEHITTNGKANTYQRNVSQEGKILHPAKIDFSYNTASVPSNVVSGLDRVIRPRNVSSTTSEHGVVSHKVQYPERFNIAESLAEMGELREESETADTTIESEHHQQTKSSSSSSSSRQSSHLSGAMQKNEPEE